MTTKEFIKLPHLKTNMNLLSIRNAPCHDDLSQLRLGFFRIETMKPLSEETQIPDEPACSEELKAKKLIIEKRQKIILSELGKTVSELKNGLYRLDKSSED